MAFGFKYLSHIIVKYPSYLSSQGVAGWLKWSGLLFPLFNWSIKAVDGEMIDIMCMCTIRNIL